MKIAEAAKRSGLSSRTIRHHEDIGLIRPERSENGYRRFTDSDLHELAFLARARSLGFRVEDCRGLLRSLRGYGPIERGGEADCGETPRAARSQARGAREHAKGARTTGQAMRR